MLTSLLHCFILATLTNFILVAALRHSSRYKHKSHVESRTSCRMVSIFDASHWMFLNKEALTKNENSDDGFLPQDTLVSRFLQLQKDGLLPLYMQYLVLENEPSYVINAYAEIYLGNAFWLYGDFDSAIYHYTRAVGYYDTNITATNVNAV